MKPADLFVNQTYLNLETFRRSGEGMKTPVWFVQQGERLYVRTLADSGKAKRLHNNPGINVSPCKADGEPIGGWLPARGCEALGGQAFEASINHLFDVKYGGRNREMTRKAAEGGRKYTILEIVFD